ncbi:MAG TPA: hypothetical protein VFP30_03105 [Candidatus Limnocylindria bacterium]|nr:hypothetical protein [Candidatus Limnocylindria bacterium]
MQRSSTPPDGFIATLPDDVRDDIAMLDAQLSRVFQGHERVLWEGVFWGGTTQNIIGYGSYHYKGRSGAGGEWFIVGLAVQKAHLSLYVSGAQDGASLAKHYAHRLGKVKVGSANVTFKRLADLDLAVALEMAERARDLMAEAR